MLVTTSIKAIATLVKQGGVIAYPTESIYGLGCNPYNEAAFQQLLQCKQRDINKGVILIASSYEQVASLLQPLSAALQQKLLTPQPEHQSITWLVPAHDRCPKWLTGQYTSLAVRITQHPPVTQLCNTLNYALVSTSANTSGEAPLNHVPAIAEHFNGLIDGVLDQPLGLAQKPSKIIDLLTDHVIRC